MTLALRPAKAADLERLHAICVAAFRPAHQGFARALGPEVFALQYRDWEGEHARYLADPAAAEPGARLHAAEVAGELVGFVVTRLDRERRVGEIGLNAIDPARQGAGLGRAMYRLALDLLRAEGAAVAYVGTAGDAAHAPARAAYAAVGFDREIPSVHLFRTL